jgi:SAM-dependent methyltransferase
MRPGEGSKARAFYDSLYRGHSYAQAAEPGDYLAWVQALLKETGSENGRFLEIGCGRGHLQQAAPGYVGVDISPEAGRFLKKPFVCAAAEALPFRDQVFDLVMSFWVLEHLTDLESALDEMARVLKKGGTLVLTAAWRVPPWTPMALDRRPYRGLSLAKKVLKLSLPLLNLLWMKGVFRLPIRAWRELGFLWGNGFRSLPYTRLKPNWQEYLLPDSDAAASVDNHACALWLYARGFRGGKIKGVRQRIFLRCGPLILEKT